LGFQNVIDIGSGDGRLIFCGSILGLNSIGVEIDKDLCDLQNEISISSNVKYKVINGDSNSIDYSQFKLENTIIFICALPELGKCYLIT
jgi:16S rRNA A1518/A1519 N6-dimethyltransferase RsmA/KsgA/DIM1 with predicted DNA glycosylase/AP lyase activity